MSRHSAFTPQGEGLHPVFVGSTTEGSTTAGTGRQSAKALPVNPSRHEHDGAWLTTRHSALAPQVPGQGSTHLRLTHACLDGQSELMTHSGRQFGTEPIIPARQAHWATPPTAWHWAFEPQGGGLHGFGGMGRKVPSSTVGEGIGVGMI